MASPSNMTERLVKNSAMKSIQQLSITMPDYKQGYELQN